MATADVQISAFISAATKDLLEKHARASGLKKAHVVEMALLHHLQVLQEIPDDVIIPPRIVLTKKEGRKLLRRLAKPARPTRSMRELMRG
jgi:uncharacterized protein (DUF1778 family)